MLLSQRPSSAKAGFTVHACRAGRHRISNSDHAVDVVKRRVNHGHRISNVMSATYHIVIVQRNLYLYRKASNVLHTSSRSTSWLPDWAADVWSNNSYLNHTSSLSTSWLPDWAAGVWSNNSLLKTRTDHTSPEPTHWRERPGVEVNTSNETGRKTETSPTTTKILRICTRLSSGIVSSGGNPLPKS